MQKSLSVKDPRAQWPPSFYFGLSINFIIIKLGKPIYRFWFWFGVGGIALAKHPVVAETRVVAAGPASVVLSYQSGTEPWGRRFLVGLPLAGAVELQVLEMVPEAADQPHLGEIGFLRRQRVVELEVPPSAKARF